MLEHGQMIQRGHKDAGEAEVLIVQVGALTWQGPSPAASVSAAAPPSPSAVLHTHFGECLSLSGVS